jgi:sugar phosphate isomerase/epimerase
MIWEVLYLSSSIQQGRIGFSLPVTYLSDNISNEEDVLWSKMYHSVSDCLAALKDNGVSTVEINKLKERTPLDHAKKSVEAVLKSGLGITAHGWIPVSMDGQLLSIIDQMESAYKEFGRSAAIPMAVHGHGRSPEKPIEKAEGETVADLRRLTNTLDIDGSLFVPALEVCRNIDNSPVGATFREVLNIADQVGYQHLGICWDMGHTQSNSIKKTDVPFPDTDFLKRVIHTHIHDILPNGRTHGPVLNDKGYVQECIDLLKGVNYSGVYNMEFYPIRWNETPEECRNLVVRSIQMLRTMVAG